MDTKQKTFFFLGASSPQGFVSRFSELLDPSTMFKTFIIKSGPGTGKSSLMRTIAAKAETRGEAVEYIACSSDPDSLDAIILQQSRMAILDGTAPHTVEPKYPGAFESVINLYDCMEEESLLENREVILDLFHQNTVLHEKAGHYLSAAGSILSDTYRFANSCFDHAKLVNYAAGLARREIPACKHSQPGHEYIRFLSGISGKGVTVFRDTVENLCDKKLVIDDPYGAVSRELLAALRDHAIEEGYDVISCYCPMSPNDKLEHLFIPGLRLGLFTSNKFHPFQADAYQCIHARRFLDNAAIKAKKQRLAFNYKAVNELIAEAASILKEAKGVHDEMERHYRETMDFDLVNRRVEEVEKRIRSFAKGE